MERKCEDYRIQHHEEGVSPSVLITTPHRSHLDYIPGAEALGQYKDPLSGVELIDHLQIGSWFRSWEVHIQEENHQQHH